MKAQKLDLGMAIAACARGYKCSRYSNYNDTLEMFEGEPIIRRFKGRDIKLSSVRRIDWFERDWYVIGDDNSWYKKDTIQST